MNRRAALLACLVLLSALLFLDLPGSWLMEPDEARYAEIPREMLVTRDFVTPRLNGTLYFEKPPLLYWANAGSIALFGPHPYAARLPVRLATLGTLALLLTGLGESFAAGEGLWAAFIFLSAPLSFWLGRLNLIDGLLTFAMTLELLALRRFFLRRERGERATGSLVLVGLGAALAVLAKGLVGIALPGLVALAWVALLGRWRRLTEILLSPAPAVFLLLTAPWFIAVERANPGFFHFFFIREHLERYATPEAARPEPIYFFPVVLLLGFLPWSFFVPWFRAFLPAGREAWRKRADDLFLSLWFLVPLVFFSFSQSKLMPYILPALPATAILAARRLNAPGGAPARGLLWHALLLTLIVPSALAYGIRSGALGRFHGEEVAAAMASALVAGAWLGVLLSRRGRLAGTLATAGGYAAFSLLLVLALPRLSRDLSSHDLAVAAERSGAQDVVAFGCYPQVFPWELGRDLTVVAHRGELGSDGDFPPALYWSQEEFWRRWNSDERLAVVVRPRDNRRFEDNRVKRPVPLGRNREYVLLANFGEGGSAPRAIARRPALP